MARPSNGVIVSGCPGFYNPDNAKKWGYSPNYGEVRTQARDWAKHRGIGSAMRANKRIAFLGIDVQDDFSNPQGTLYVSGRSGDGAIKDSQRMAQFLYRNMGALTSVSLTLDTHFPLMVFSPAFWTQKGQDAGPFQFIKPEQIRSGEFQVNPMMASLTGNLAWLQQYVLHYADSLERNGKYTLYLWPEHCMIGTPGHALVGVIAEAAYAWSYARGKQLNIEIKGTDPLTEFYSVFKPEVAIAHDGQAVSQQNTAFLDTLLKNDAVIIGGQAASHCVKSSIDDLLETAQQDPALAKKCYILKDCMSSVVVRDPNGKVVVDFTDDAEKALDKFSAGGMNLVNSTDDINTWPGM